MFWAMVGVVGGSVALLFWLRGLSPDTSAEPLTSTGRPAQRGSVGAARATAPAARPVGARSSGLKSAESPFAAVSIKPGEHGCAAAADLTNIRYLEGTAPHLPLGECDRLACNCVFQRHADRRLNEHGERRGTQGAQAASEDMGLTVERRQLHGRRITDRS